MIYKFALQLFRILLGLPNKSTYFDQKQRAFRHFGCALDMHTSQVIINMKLDFPKSF
jgi:hypothetical protein